MADLPTRQPDTVPATGDPGDDTARRYRYQWTYAAIVCCMLLDETEDAAEVFCEQHEDILIKHTDGTFSGLQIKTRESSQAVWRTSDEAVRHSCARFAKLEAEFPGRFRAFRFCTNHPLHAANNGQGLRHVLETVSAASSVNDLSGPVQKFLVCVADEAGCAPEVAFTALCNTEAFDDLPKLPDVETRLVKELTSVWSRAEDCSYRSVQRAARSLLVECERASSLAHEDVLPAYLPATDDPVGAELSARLADKRMDRPRVLAVLDLGFDETAPLDGDPDALVEPGTGATHLLLKKLDAGGFSVVSCNSAKDLRDKADYLGLVWINKHGRIRGLQRYGQVRSLVLKDAAQAFEATKRVDRAFGPDMLSTLRERLEQRREGVYDCSNEHLEGFAYSLTSQCEVQWSHARPWESA
ncbi:MAG TPA: dsDNA nuclease domain-containing protein [Phycisphaerae bacterium]|nr:dsDNA nuclease domain-containing protein [Phycisphaerae bacterium]HUU93377.1 dsDNA nuclease domain-containing protein [Phycisphaerae bacterium]